MAIHNQVAAPEDKWLKPTWGAGFMFLCYLGPIPQNPILVSQAPNILVSP